MEGTTEDRRDALDEYRSPLQLAADGCDTPEEALRTLALPFFERPQAGWLHSIVTKIGRRSARACVGWLGAHPAVLKARAYWPPEGPPRVEVLRWSGDALTAAYAWRELEAQALGLPPSPGPPWGPQATAMRLPADEDDGGLSPLLDMLLYAGDYYASEAAVALGSLGDLGALRALPVEALERLRELSERHGDPMVALPSTLALARAG